MGPYYVPPSEAWQRVRSPAPGTRRGTRRREHRCRRRGRSGEGNAVRRSPEPLSTTTLQKDPCSEFRYQLTAGQLRQSGALPPPEVTCRRHRTGGRGRARRGCWWLRGSCREFDDRWCLDREAQADGWHHRLQPQHGDKLWIPNGRHDPGHEHRPAIAGVTLPRGERPGSAQAITTKSLGQSTGRDAAAVLRAARRRSTRVDKATGRHWRGRTSRRARARFR